MQGAGLASSESTSSPTHNLMPCLTSWTGCLEIVLRMNSSIRTVPGIWRGVLALAVLCW